MKRIISHCPSSLALFHALVAVLVARAEAVLGVGAVARRALTDHLERGLRVVLVAVLYALSVVVLGEQQPRRVALREGCPNQHVRFCVVEESSRAPPHRKAARSYCAWAAPRLAAWRSRLTSFVEALGTSCLFVV